MIEREFQKTLLKRLQEKAPLLQMILGPRQVGKTTGAQWIFNRWKGPKFMVSADDPSPPGADWIRVHWQEALAQGPNTLLIFDEIQKVTGWSEVIKQLFDQERGRGRIKVALMGSSSLFLQKGLSESLTGRFELTEVPHWSFLECHQAFGWDLNTYMKWGAYPGAIPFKGDAVRWKHYILNSIVETVISKDIYQLNPVHKPALFRQTFELAVRHPAHIISLQKMLGQLQDRGNATTIKGYLDLLQKSYLIRALQKYSGSEIRIKDSSPKIIVLNPALIHAYVPQTRLIKEPGWYGFVFESIMGAHLAMLPDTELFYWRDNNAEVDFVLRTPNDLFAIEIKSGFKDKHSGLAAFQKQYPKARCQLWDYTRCCKFLEQGRFLS